MIESINIDPSLGAEFADQIAQNPKSFCKLAGRKILGIRSPSRRRAEEAVPQLCEALKSYADMAQHTMENLIEQHQREQRRIAHSVEKPGRDLQQLLPSHQNNKEKSCLILLHCKNNSILLRANYRIVSPQKSIELYKKTIL